MSVEGTAVARAFKHLLYAHFPLETVSYGSIFHVAWSVGDAENDFRGHIQSVELHRSHRGVQVHAKRICWKLWLLSAKASFILIAWHMRNLFVGVDRSLLCTQHIK